MKNAGVCSHSISRRLSRKLALLTMAVLGVCCSWGAWIAVEMLMRPAATTQDAANSAPS